MKKLYVRPCVYVVEVEVMTLLAGSGDTEHVTESGPGTGGNESEADDGGNLSKDDLYNIWGDNEW